MFHLVRDCQSSLLYLIFRLIFWHANDLRQCFWFSFLNKKEKWLIEICLIILRVDSNTSRESGRWRNNKWNGDVHFDTQSKRLIGEFYEKLNFIHLVPFAMAVDVSFYKISKNFYWNRQSLWNENKLMKFISLIFLNNIQWKKELRKLAQAVKKWSFQKHKL